MHVPPHRYLTGLLAFAATVTLLTVGVTITVAGLAACAAVLYGDRLVALRPRRRERRPRVRARVRPAEYQLVPDEPSLIISARS